MVNNKNSQNMYILIAIIGAVMFMMYQRNRVTSNYYSYLDAYGQTIVVHPADE